MIIRKGSCFAGQNILIKVIGPGDKIKHFKIITLTNDGACVVKNFSREALEAQADFVKITPAEMKQLRRRLLKKFKTELRNLQIKIKETEKF